MIFKSYIRVPLSTIGIMVLTALLSHSEVLFWDGNPTTGDADGGNGTWNLSNTNWDSAERSGTDQVWSNIVANSAVFGGTAGTVTLASPITVSGLSFNTSGYVLNGSTSALNISGNVRISLGTGVSLATLTGGVAGSGSVTLSLGTLSLNGTSAGGWTGATTLDPAIVMALSQNSQALANTSAINLNGGTVSVTSNGPTEALLNRISDSAPITSNGGTLAFANTSGSTVYSENIGSVQLSSGQTNFAFTNNQSGTGSQTLTLAGLTRTGASSVVTFSSQSGLNTTKNRIVVTGAPLGFIGPWATAGSAANNQTDYAFINGASQVIGANIAATTENSGSWISGANVTLGSSTTLTAPRTINTLRYTGAAGTLALGVHNLNSYGILSGGSGTLSITGTGVISTPSGGGNLFLTAGRSALSISAPINDHAGGVTLVKSGSSNLTLNSTSSNYSGGTVINTGSLIISNTSNLGAMGTSLTFNGSGSLLGTADFALNRPIIINHNAIASFGASTTTDRRITTNAAISGTGGIALTHARYITLSASSKLNTFSGPIYIGSQGNAVNNSAVFRTNSLSDNAGDGNIIFGSHTAGHSNSTNGQMFMWGDVSTGTTPNANIGGSLTLNHRAFVLAGTGPSAVIWNGSDSAAQTITVNTDLQITAAGNKTLFLAGPNAGENTFAGKITNGSGAISLTKKDAGRWIISGDNSYSGLTTVSAGRLNIRNSNALGTTANGVSITSGASLEIQNDIAVGAEALTLRGTGILSGGALRNISGNNSWGGAITLAATSRINSDVGTLSLDVASGNAIGGTFGLSFGGAGNISVHDAIATGTGTITKDGTGTLTLSSANTYTGLTSLNAGRLNIRHANALGTTTNGVSVTSGASLEIQNNIAIGAEALTLRGTGISSGGALRNISGNNSWGGAITLAADSRINSDSSNLTLDVVSGNAIAGTFNLSFGGAGDISVNDAIATGARALTKDGTGTLRLNSTNTYTGVTNINSGTALINGSTSSSSIVTVATAGTLGGTGIIRGATTINGALRPGVGVGLISFGSSLTLASSSQTTMNIDGTARGTAYDAISVGTALSYGGGLTLDLGNTFAEGSSTFDLFNFGTRTGSFSSVSLTNAYSGALANNGTGVWSLTSGSQTWSFNQSTGDLSLTVIPEPSLTPLCLMSIALTLSRRRKS
jgi:autotransporter-associated beta strand protein